MNSNVKAVVDYCSQRIALQTKKPLFVAIAGDSGSGKSFLTALIKDKLEAEGLSCVVLNHDEFLISRAAREPMKSIYYETGDFAGKSHWELLENMFRLDDFANVIDELKLGKCAEYHRYSRHTGEVSPVKSKICPEEIILLDTSMMLDKADFTILVDVTQENIIKCKLIRDSDVRTLEQITEMHKKVQGYYWERGKPDHADIVIDNNDFSNIRIVKH